MFQTFPEDASSFNLSFLLNVSSYLRLTPSEFGAKDCPKNFLIVLQVFFQLFE